MEQLVCLIFWGVAINGCTVKENPEGKITELHSVYVGFRPEYALKLRQRKGMDTCCYRRKHVVEEPIEEPTLLVFAN